MFKAIKEFFFGKPTQAQEVVAEAPYKVEVPVVTQVVEAPVAETKPAAMKAKKKPAGKKPQGPKPAGNKKPRGPKKPKAN